ncbi:MAG: DnaB-like helicase C-terminal domain-containing protein, partial [Ignavibacteriae bacterium]|nr:DnaB-like helicase C-terminal domain-containing protein [Ignavibacteriota bacterium]
LLIRMLSSEARVDNTKLKTGRATDVEWNRVASNFHKLKTNIYIDDSSELSVLELRAKARRIKQEFGIDMIIVDYLQLIRGLSSHERRDLEVAYVSRSLKALAKELDIPVVACAQLNRGIEQRGKEKRPQLADLRESGAIEQDADVVIFMHRPFLTQKNDPTDPGYEELRHKCEVTIGKQRNGPTGDFDLVFFPEFTKFENKIKKPDTSFPDTRDVEETPF